MSASERRALVLMAGGLEYDPPSNPGSYIFCVADVLGYEWSEIDGLPEESEPSFNTELHALLAPVTLKLTRHWSAARFRHDPRGCVAFVTAALESELGAPTGSADGSPIYELQGFFQRQARDVVFSLASWLGEDAITDGLLQLVFTFSDRFPRTYPARAGTLAKWLAPRVEALVA